MGKRKVINKFIFVIGDCRKPGFDFEGLKKKEKKAQ
jgi:hypothetical protein